MISKETSAVGRKSENESREGEQKGKWEGGSEREGQRESESWNSGHEIMIFGSLFRK